MARHSLLFLSFSFFATPLCAEKHAYPDFSPDGKSLVFSADREGTQDLYVAHDGEKPHRLTSYDGSETQPTWSPDGKRIAYVRTPWNPTTQSALYVIDRDGQNNQRVGRLVGVHLPHWASDGRIYLSLRVKGRDDIVSIRPDGSDQVNHTNTPDLDETNAAVYGRTLVYDRPDGDDYVIEWLDLDNGKKRVLRRGATDWDPEWLPGGNGLVVGVYASRDATKSVLTQFDLEGNVVRQWTPTGQNAFWPTVSPDGKRVVFSLSDKDFGVGELYVLSLEDGTLRPLVFAE